MASNHSDNETSLFATVDFRAFFETLRLRWWVIPVVVAASVGFLQAQESDLRTEPESFIVSRGYEVASPARTLLSVGINLAYAEFPEAQTQLLILKSSEVREEISAKLGKSVDVQVPDNWETPVTFTCNQPVKADCVEAIEAYVSKASELRKNAIAKGLESLQSLLLDTKNSNPDTVTPAQLAALEAVQKNLEVPFALVDSFEQAVGPTVNEVQRPTYLMGVAAGLLISLLILLQLTYSDSRVRSVRQLVRLVGPNSYLGRVTAKSDSVADRRIALSLHHSLKTGPASGLRYVPLRNSLHDESSLTRLTEMVGTSQTVTEPFAQLTVQELGNPADTHADVIVVQRNRDLRNDVVEALFALEHSGRVLAGVLLVG